MHPKTNDFKAKCPLCQKTYNQKENCPRMFASCNHSICQRCLLKRITIAGQSRLIRCQACNFEIKITGDICEDLKIFPINERMLTSINLNCAQKENQCCKNQNGKGPLVCLNKSCSDRSLFCLRCVGVRHLKCDEKLFVGVNNLKKNVVLERAKVNFDEIEYKMTDILNQRFSAAKRRTLAFITACLNELKNSNKSTEELSYENIEFLHRAAQPIYDPDDKIVRMITGQDQVLNEHIKSLEEYFSVEFCQRLDTHIGILLTQFFERFKTDEQTDSNIAAAREKLAKSDILFLESYAFKNLPTKPVFSFTEFARDLKKALGVQALKICTVNVNSSDLEAQIEQKFISITKSLIADGITHTGRLQSELSCLILELLGKQHRLRVSVESAMNCQLQKLTVGLYLDFCINDLRIIVSGDKNKSDSRLLNWSGDSFVTGKDKPPNTTTVLS